MMNLTKCLHDNKHVLFLVLFVIIIVHILISHITLYVPSEGFVDNEHSVYEDAHGSAPAGVNAFAGEVQYKQNADSPHVNAANKLGNPQNTLPELKKQPLFSY